MYKDTAYTAFLRHFYRTYTANAPTYTATSTEKNNGLAIPVATAGLWNPLLRIREAGRKTGGQVEVRVQEM